MSLKAKKYIKKNRKRIEKNCVKSRKCTYSKEKVINSLKTTIDDNFAWYDNI